METISYSRYGPEPFNSQQHWCEGGYLIFVIPIGSKYVKKKSESKKRQFRVFENVQNQRDVSFGYLATNQMQRTNGFQERPGKDPSV